MWGIGAILLLSGLAAIQPASLLVGAPLLLAGAALLWIARKRGRPPGRDETGRWTIFVLAEAAAAIGAAIVAIGVFDAFTGLFGGFDGSDLLGGLLFGAPFLYLWLALHRALAATPGTGDMSKAALNGAAQAVAIPVVAILALSPLAGVVEGLRDEGPTSADTVFPYFVLWPAATIAAVVAGAAWRRGTVSKSASLACLWTWAALGVLTVVGSLACAIPLRATEDLLLLGFVAMFGAGATLIAWRNLADASARSAMRAGGGILALGAGVLAARLLLGLVAYTGDFEQVTQDWHILVLIYPLVFLGAAGLLGLVAWRSLKAARRSAGR